MFVKPLTSTLFSQDKQPFGIPTSLKFSPKRNTPKGPLTGPKGFFGAKKRPTPPGVLGGLKGLSGLQGGFLYPPQKSPEKIGRRGLDFLRKKGQKTLGGPPQGKFSGV